MAGILQRNRWILPTVLVAAAAGILLFFASGTDVESADVPPGSLPAIEVDAILQQTRQKKGYEQYVIQAGEALRPEVDITIEVGTTYELRVKRSAN